MDHLDHPKHNAHQAFRIPCLARDYVKPPSTSFLEYPTSDGWSTERLCRGDKHGRHTVEVAAFIQTWLFFGLLSEILQTEIRVCDYVRHVAYPETFGVSLPYISTQALPLHISQWRRRQMRTPQSSKDVYAKSVGDLLEEVSMILQRITENMKMDQTLERVILSICLLAETLTMSITSVEGFNRSARWNNIRPLYVPWAKDRLMEGMIGWGWCPHTAARARSSLHLSSLAIAAELNPTDRSKDHRSCTKDVCIAGQADKNYGSPHCTADCLCEWIGVNEEELCRVYAEGKIPLLQLVRDYGSDKPRLKIAVSEPDTSYTAISHVWADGCGNPKDLSLPTCRMEMINWTLSALPNAKGTNKMKDRPSDSVLRGVMNKAPSRAAQFWSQQQSNLTHEGPTSANIGRQQLLEATIKQLQAYKGVGEVPRLIAAIKDELSKAAQEDRSRGRGENNADDSLSYSSPKRDSEVDDERNHFFTMPDPDLSPKFWIDTICVPLKDQRAKMMALDRMAKIYAQAEQVLVEDAGLHTTTISENMVENCLRVYLTLWVQRVWTLQEAWFAKKLYFNFKQGMMECQTAVVALGKLYYDWEHGTGCINPIIHDLLPFMERLNQTISTIHPPDHHFGAIWSNLQWRSITVESDKATCIAILFGKDPTPLLQYPEHERLGKLFSSLESVPMNVIFLPGRKVDMDGVRWAPDSFFSRREGMTMSKMVDVGPSGIVVQYPGIILIEGRKVRQMNSIVVRDDDTDYFLDHKDQPDDWTASVEEGKKIAIIFYKRLGYTQNCPALVGSVDAEAVESNKLNSANIIRFRPLGTTATISRSAISETQRLSRGLFKLDSLQAALFPARLTIQRGEVSTASSFPPAHSPKWPKDDHIENDDAIDQDLEQEMAALDAHVQARDEEFDSLRDEMLQEDIEYALSKFIFRGTLLSNQTQWLVG